MAPSPVGSTTAAAPRDLNTYYRNPRRGDTSAIAASLKAHSQYKPIVVNVGTHTGRPNEVLAGNHTLMAIRDLAEQYPEDDRWQSVLVHWVDVDNDRAARIVLVDNRASELGGMDIELLAELLAELPDVDGTGYTSADLDAFQPLDLDSLADRYGEGMTAEDMLERVTLSVTEAVSAKWTAHRAEYSNDEDALVALL